MKHIAEQFELPLPANTPRAFFFHFNKPLSKQKGKPQISVHQSGKCMIADNVDCRVPCRGRISKRQPYFVMTGRGVIHWVNFTALITHD